MPNSTRFLFILLASLATACNQSAQRTAESASIEQGRTSAMPASDTAGLGQKPGWWKKTTVYQLYPRSFQDGNGDGIGDLKGIQQRLHYLKSLGVGTVWLNSIYASPNDDNGYDISDYQKIMPDFSTMADFDALLKGIHQRGLKLVMDVVVNHSSDEHTWFKQVRSSRTNSYRDYYWWPAEKGTPPARYSTFDVRKNAWQCDSTAKSYYLHYFPRKQPDLNWNNPKVRQEVYKMMRFWADKGVDGFRMDAFQFVAKDPSFPPMPGLTESNYTNAYNRGLHLHDYLQEMNREVLSRYNLLTVAEGAGRNPQEARLFVGPARKELDMTYHFDAVGVGDKRTHSYKLSELKDVFGRWEQEFATTGWQAIYLGSHDQPRIVSRFGDDRPAFRAPSAKLLNMFILSMHGTPYCYYGDELGMTNSGFTSMADYRDVQARNGYQLVKSQKGDEAAYLRSLSYFSRDNARTPFQWSAAPQAGFTTGTPWIKVNPNYLTVNEAAEDKDSASVLNHFRRATAMRKLHPVLVYGDYQLLDKNNPHVWACTRTRGSDKALVVLNFSAAPQRWAMPAGMVPAGAPWLNNYPALALGPTLALQPWQAVVLPLR